MSEVTLDLAGTRCIIRGDLDGSASDSLEKALDEALVQRPRDLTLDFHDAEYINSTGIGALVGVLKRAREEGLALRAVGLSDHYKHIFEITRLVDFIEIADDLEEGVGGHE